MGKNGALTATIDPRPTRADASGTPVSPQKHTRVLRLAKHSLSGLFLLALILIPLPESASARSILDGLFGKRETKDDINSQTIALLRASLSPTPGPVGGGDITIVGDSALLAEAGPVGTAVDAVNERSPDEISIYVVRRGDSISGIAKMFGVTPSTIIWANDIERGIVTEGQKLVILPVSGIQYTIKEGDTIKKVSDKYKADLAEVLAYNGLSLETKLVPGDTIIIPDVEGNLVRGSPTKSLPTSRLRGIGGPSYDGYYLRPLAWGYRSQGLHGYNGVDLAGVPVGTPIMAAAAGSVIISRQGGWNGGYGNYVVITHDNGTQTLYAHNLSNSVSVGERVSQGQIIGYVGSTGKSTGPHVHFEVRGAKNPF